MRLGRLLLPSLRGLLVHRARSALAAGGVAIGIAAVVLTSALADGAQAEVARSLGVMGTRLLVIRPAAVKRTAARRELAGLVSSLKPDDGPAVGAVPLVTGAAPVVEGPVKVRSTRGAVATSVLGTTTAFFRVRDFVVERGRLFAPETDGDRARVAVLGGRLARTLFDLEDPVGQEVRIGRVTFEVVGTLRPKGAAADGADADNQVFVPVRTARDRLLGTRSLSAIFVGVGRTEDLAPVAAEIRALLRARHRLDARALPDDFTIQDQLRFLAAQRRTARSLGLLAAGLGAVALLVGGTGILALMLLSVRERTPEIGLRLAVGARRRDILGQFLAEALALALAGGLAGLALGAAGTWLLGLVLPWPLRVAPEAGLLALALAAGVGLVFGALPARRAALLPAVRALGME